MFQCHSDWYSIAQVRSQQCVSKRQKRSLITILKLFKQLEKFVVPVSDSSRHRSRCRSSRSRAPGSALTHRRSTGTPAIGLNPTSASRTRRGQPRRRGRRARRARPRRRGGRRGRRGEGRRVHEPRGRRGQPRCQVGLRHLPAEFLLDGMHQRAAVRGGHAHPLRVAVQTLGAVEPVVRW